ncbi:hypothetical protein SK128_010692, partial [Halocaridina rubra]
MFEPARFDMCLMDYFGINNEFGRLECYLKDNVVFLQPPSSSVTSAKPFQTPHQQPQLRGKDPTFRVQV